MSSDWILWQLADSAFPTGSFAHSGGLESAWQAGHVARGESFGLYVREALWQCVNGTVPFMTAAFDSPATFAAIDCHCDAFISNHIANRASRAQGRALAASASGAFGLPALARLHEEVRDHGGPGHFAAVFGVVTAALGLSRSEAIHLLLFAALRSLISSAVRLGIVGPIEGQRTQAGLAGELDTFARQAEIVTLDDAAQTAPLLDLLQGTQDRLYSRLFHS